MNGTFGFFRGEKINWTDYESIEDWEDMDPCRIEREILLGVFFCVYKRS